MSFTHFRVNLHPSCLNVKEFLAQNRCNTWSLSDCNRTWTHNHLGYKQKLNHLAKLAKWLSSVWAVFEHSAKMAKWSSVSDSVWNMLWVLTPQLNHLASLAKWLNVCLWTKWLWVQILLLSLKLQIFCLFQARSYLTFSQLQSVDSLWNTHVT